jgi:hypothetical protein
MGTHSSDQVCRGRRWTRSPDQLPVRATGRPLRDRAIVYILLSTRPRREEQINVDLDQICPNTPVELKRARQGRITRVQGKGKTPPVRHPRSH